MFRKRTNSLLSFSYFYLPLLPLYLPHFYLLLLSKSYVLSLLGPLGAQTGYQEIYATK